MIVKPKTPKTIVRDPKTFVQLPPEGKRVPDTSYWCRRLACGDVVPTTAEAIAKAKGKPESKPKDSEPSKSADDSTEKQSKPKSKGNA